MTIAGEVIDQAAMSAVQALLDKLTGSDIHLSVDGGKLRVNAPKGALTDELKAAIGVHRDSLILMLGERAQEPKPRDVYSIARIPRGGGLPVSSAQKRFWFLDQLAPGGPEYNICSALRVRGALDTLRLRRALDMLVSRHETLHMRIVGDATGPVAELLAPQVSLRELDLSERPTQAHDEALRELLGIAMREGFPLHLGPLCRFVLVRLAQQEHVLVLLMHHAVGDGWSLGIAMAEIFGIYAALGRGGESSLPPLPVQYADYAAWEREQLQSGRLARQLEYWRKHLAGTPVSLELPFDRPRLPVQSLRGSHLNRRIELAPLRALKEVGRREGVTLFMTLLASWQILLHRYCGQDDIVIGTPVANRKLPVLEGLIGCLVNNIVLRSQLDGNPTFKEYLAQVRTVTLEAFDNGEVPFNALVEALNPPRTTSHAPVYQVMFSFLSVPARITAPAGLSIDLLEAQLLESVRDTARVDLSLDVLEMEEALYLSYEYSTDLFDASTIERLHEHFAGLLAAVAADPQGRIRDFPLITAAELTQLHRFNETVAELPQTLFVAGFTAAARRAPRSVALVHGQNELTYEELHRRSSQLAQTLREKGVTRGVRVAICLERSPSLIVALLAVQMAAGTYVPLDPGFPAKRREFMLADSKSAVLVTSDDAVADVEIPEGVSVLKPGDPATAGARVEMPALEARPEDAAYLIYTSGSTGLPKGVAVSHGSLMNLLLSMAREPGLGATDVLAAVTTISFDIAGLELYLPLLVGARIELVSAETAADGPGLAALLGDRGVTVLQATPATWRLLVEADWHGPPGFRAFCGGEALPQDLAESLLARVSELWNLYGPTETTIWSSAGRVERAGDITIGRPISNTQIYTVGNTGALQPIGVPGEIWIGGAGVALGYANRPELTAERFVPDRLGAQPGMRLYRTGDLGRWRKDGRLEHLGRLDHQVKIRGFRIEVGEIEATLGSLDAVRQAVVVARDAGSSDRRLVAYVVYQPGADLTVSEIRRHLRARLPEYMVPSLVVAMDAMPLTPNGKVDRAALPDPFGNAAAGSTQYAPPTTQMEILLAAIWAEVLKIERVGLNDNFFDLGGHSLLSLQVAAALAARTGWRMDPRTLFFQTLGQIAATAVSGAREWRRA